MLKREKRFSKIDVEANTRRIHRAKFRGAKLTENSTGENNCTLGKHMKELYEIVQKGRVKAVSAEARKVLKNITECRYGVGVNIQKMFDDYLQYLWLREEQMRKIEEEIIKPLPELKTNEYWGTRQQLRFGMVVADCLGGIDPVFGALLYPAGGRLPDEPLVWQNDWIFIYNDALAYHTAVHDACEYLKSYHGLGPGFKYYKMPRKRLLHWPVTSPLGDLLAGMQFWNNFITENTHRIARNY